MTLLATARERITQLEAENASLRNQLGDNLCWLEDTNDPLIIRALPEAEVEESCRRYQAQMRTERGVFSGGRTIAQLEQDNTRLRKVLAVQACVCRPAIPSEGESAYKCLRCITLESPAALSTAGADATALEPAERLAEG